MPFAAALASGLPLPTIWVLTLVAVRVAMICRFYRVGPPGGLFFVMASAIGAFTPGTLAEVPLKVGLITMGALLGAVIAFFHGACILRPRAPDPSPRPSPDFDYVGLDAVEIGAFVEWSLAIAQALQMDRPSWAPVGCVAVIQGGFPAGGPGPATPPRARHRGRTAALLGPAGAAEGPMEHRTGDDGAGRRDRSPGGPALRRRGDLRHAADRPARGGRGLRQPPAGGRGRPCGGARRAEAMPACGWHRHELQHRIRVSPASPLRRARPTAGLRARHRAMPLRARSDSTTNTLT